MSGPNAIMALAPDERPSGYQPDATTPAGVPETATVGDGSHACGGHSLAEQVDAVRADIALMLRKALEVHTASESINENGGMTIMRQPVADLMLQIEMLRAQAMRLMRKVRR